MLYEFEDGSRGCIQYDALRISRPVISVGRMNDKGSSIHFDPDQAVLIPKDAKRLALWKQNNTFILRATLLRQEDRTDVQEVYGFERDASSGSSSSSSSPPSSSSVAEPGVPIGRAAKVASSRPVPPESSEEAVARGLPIK